MGRISRAVEKVAKANDRVQYPRDAKKRLRDAQASGDAADTARAAQELRDARSFRRNGHF